MSMPVKKLTACREQVRVRGIVQGVGFRPTVWRIANELEICGYTRNDGDGVLIEAWGSTSQLAEFSARIRAQSPPLARIDDIERQIMNYCDPPGSFEIIESGGGPIQTAVVADAGTCPDCVHDSLDPFGRRYRYPFTNCTNCGPRISITREIPYDRANTSMSNFEMCADCAAEYADPTNRRFHAQPNACHVCGPKAILVRTDGRALFTENLTQLDDVDAACSLLQKGELVAIKGIGGFHLACDATNEDAVALLRERKNRIAKPFALMAANMDIIKSYSHVTDQEMALLQSPAAPIVILRRIGFSALPDNVAPGQSTVGFMLPYTPLHHLLLRRMRRPIVLTSGNLSDEPQCISNEEVCQRLQSICDYALLHDRDIENRLDDSVVRVMAGAPRIIRRARGYAPAPVSLPPGFETTDNIIAMGGDLKSTFCLIKNRSALLSQHIGDLHDAPTFCDYEKNIGLYMNLFEHSPSRIVVDRHPEYMATKLGCKWAERDGLDATVVQHHHAHIAACLGDNNWPLDGGQVLGVALDGLGIGDSGQLWGGEFLLADYCEYERLGTFKPVAIPGNAQAMREPWRNTYAHIIAQMGWPTFEINYAELDLFKFLRSKPLDSIDAMLISGTNAPLASSCGRLFDAVAAALDICRDKISFEGQAAILLESMIDPDCLENESDSLAYPFTVPRLDGKGMPYIEPLAMWSALLGDMILKTPTGVMSARFHKGLAKAIVHMIRSLATRFDERYVNHVALTGGVFQNKTLLEQVVQRLEREKFTVLIHANIPANDGGLAFGQALVATAQAMRKRSDK